MELTNPFIIQGYAGDKYFCDRETETQSLLQAMESGRNVTLISPRRMGKYGLIHHVFEHIAKSQEDTRCFYIDIFHTSSLTEFINVFANAIFGSLDNSVEKRYKTVRDVFRRCRPVITPDAITGLPQLSLDMAKGEENHTMREIFDYLKNSGKRILIAIDEFQQIAEYPETGVEAMLRSYTQITPNVTFVFAGSKKHVMQQMFSLPSRPFYQSAQTMSLKPIAYEAYLDFAQRHFHDGGKEIEEEAFRTIYELVFGHTWYIQYWLSRLFDDCGVTVTREDALQVMEKILREEDDNFYMYQRLLTTAQKRVMTAVAKEGSMTTPLSHKNLANLGLPPYSTVRSCLRTLADKELLLEERDEYTVYNRFFMLWLRSLK